MDIRSGLRVNPEMKEYMVDSDLTLQDFADMAAYLQSLPVVGNIAQGPPELVPRGQALYARDCAACHGEHGEGRSELFYPMLASQHYSYLLRELDLILTGQRGNSNPAMPPIVSNYSADDKRAVAEYDAGARLLGWLAAEAVGESGWWRRPGHSAVWLRSWSPTSSATLPSWSETRRARSPD